MIHLHNNEDVTLVAICFETAVGQIQATKPIIVSRIIAWRAFRAISFIH